MREYVSNGVDRVTALEPKDDETFAKTMLEEWRKQSSRSARVGFPRAVNVDHWKECARDALLRAPNRPFRIWLSADMFIILELPSTPSVLELPSTPSEDGEFAVLELTWRALPQDVRAGRPPATLASLCASIQVMLDRIVDEYTVKS